MKLSHIFSLALLSGVCSLAPPGTAWGAEKPKTFLFDTFDGVTIRKNPTTQVVVRVNEWPENRFLLWLPESVGSLWMQWDPAVAHQDFAKTKSGGLRWQFDGNPKARIVAELTPRRQSILLEVRVKNLTARDLGQVTAQNCLPLSEAPDFACRDDSRIFLRTGGRWVPLSDLDVNDPLPMFYRPGFLESGRIDSWGGGFKQHNQEWRAYHPLMIVLSRDGKRALGTVSEDYQCLFHNHGSAFLKCVHSQQSPVPKLAAGQEAVFRQIVYFIDGGIKEVVRAYDQDVKAGAIKP
jgi:hypothetical protein